jgi:hypothetical protein
MNHNQTSLRANLRIIFFREKIDCGRRHKLNQNKKMAAQSPLTMEELSGPHKCDFLYCESECIGFIYEGNLYFRKFSLTSRTIMVRRPNTCSLANLEDASEHNLENNERDLFPLTKGDYNFFSENIVKFFSVTTRKKTFKHKEFTIIPGNVFYGNYEGYCAIAGYPKGRKQVVFSVTALDLPTKAPALFAFNRFFQSRILEGRESTREDYGEQTNCTAIYAGNSCIGLLINGVVYSAVFQATEISREVKKYKIFTSTSGKFVVDYSTPVDEIKDFPYESNQVFTLTSPVMTLFAYYNHEKKEIYAPSIYSKKARILPGVSHDGIWFSTKSDSVEFFRVDWKQNWLSTFLASKTFPFKKFKYHNPMETLDPFREVSKKSSVNPNRVKKFIEFYDPARRFDHVCVLNRKLYHVTNHSITLGVSRFVIATVPVEARPGEESIQDVINWNTESEIVKKLLKYPFWPEKRWRMCGVLHLMQTAGK